MDQIKSFSKLENQRDAEKLRIFLLRHLHRNFLTCLFLSIVLILIWFSLPLKAPLYFVLPLWAMSFTALFGVYKSLREMRIVKLGKCLEFPVVGHFDRGPIIVKWHLPEVKDPETQMRFIAENISGYIPYEEEKLVGFKHSKSYYFISEKYFSKFKP